MSEPVPRRIDYGPIKQQLRALATQAKEQGRSEAFRQALLRLDQYLRSRPLPPEDSPDTFGEPHYEVHHKRFLVCAGVVAPIAVNFAVSLEPHEVGSERAILIWVLAAHLLSAKS